MSRAVDLAMWTSAVPLNSEVPSINVSPTLEDHTNLAHWKVHVFNSAKNNTYFINFSREIGQSKSISLSENFRIA